MPEVMRRTGLAKSTIFRRVRDGTFPQPIRLTSTLIGFIDSEVTDWIEKQMLARKRRSTDKTSVGVA
jgi:predicted DNA-binding transcriptional regulator AlpA